MQTLNPSNTLSLFLCIHIVAKVKKCLLSNSYVGFPSGSLGKESACNEGDKGISPWVGKIPWVEKWQPTPVFLPGKPHGQRSLVGYSSKGGKGSDANELKHRQTYDRETKIGGNLQVVTLYQNLQTSEMETLPFQQNFSRL